MTPYQLHKRDNKPTVPAWISNVHINIDQGCFVMHIQVPSVYRLICRT